MRSLSGPYFPPVFQLFLDFSHFHLIQIVPAHGYDCGDMAQDRHDTEAYHDGHVKGSVYGLIGLYHHISHAGQRQGKSLNHGGEGGYDFINKGEHGPHHTGYKTAAAVHLIICTVRNHGDDA